MVTKKRHISCNIDYLLKMTDKELQWLFEMNGHEVRADLEERKAAGENFIGSNKCEGFCPVNGCPGHIVEKTD
jgi:hypothetical protein